MAVDPEIQEATNFAIAMARLPASAPGSKMPSLWPWRVLRLAAALSLRTAEGYRPLDWVESLVNRAWQRLEGRGPARASCTASGQAPHSILLGDRLTVGQRTLTPPVLVRIQVPQPFYFKDLTAIFMSHSSAKTAT